MSGSQRLLIITRKIETSSFRQRIEPYIEHLTARGIDCEVQELKQGRGRRAQLKAACNYLGVWIHKKTLTRMDAFRLRRNAKKVIYEFDDAIVFRSGSESPDPHPLRLKRFRRTIGLANLVIAGNEVLADLARDYGAQDVAVIPTGLDTSRYAPKAHEHETDQIRLVWIGADGMLKQLREFTEMLDSISWELPDVILRVIADDELITETLPVENLSWSRKEEVRMLNECDIGIAPLPDTPFAQGQCAFNVLQYMAAGLPVVSSPIGANAEYVADYESGFLAYDDRHWVDSISQLVYDAELRTTQGQAGRLRACDEFDFSVLAPKVCDAIMGVLESAD
ncbi:MAG: glycosyltransferase family 4 protein [Phycisphaerae bacterium]|nr:glycosyltransferase family 4 protein [Phycisphaerae bacterium]